MKIVHKADKEGRDCAQLHGDMNFTNKESEISCVYCLQENNLVPYRKPVFVRAIVDKLFDDMNDRGGIRQALEQIDEDILEEIKDTWCKIIKEEIN